MSLPRRVSWASVLPPPRRPREERIRGKGYREPSETERILYVLAANLDYLLHEHLETGLRMRDMIRLTKAYETDIKAALKRIAHVRVGRWYKVAA